MWEWHEVVNLIVHPQGVPSYCSADSYTDGSTDGSADGSANCGTNGRANSANSSANAVATRCHFRTNFSADANTNAGAVCGTDTCAYDGGNVSFQHMVSVFGSCSTQCCLQFWHMGRWILHSNCYGILEAFGGPEPRVCMSWWLTGGMRQFDRLVIHVYVRWLSAPF